MDSLIHTVVKKMNEGRLSTRIEASKRISTLYTAVFQLIPQGWEE